MSRFSGLLLVSAVGMVFNSFARDPLVCPQGTESKHRMENKVRVEACVETKTPCTKTENIEIFSESVGKKGKCQIHHGKTRYSNPDGSELTLNYDHGKLHGQSVSHSSQKILLSEENYSHGLKQGKQKTFYENGKKKIEENFAKGLKHGEQLSWYENGELEQRSLYWEGNPTENWTSWYPNGNKKTDFIYGALGWEGLYRDWYSNGRLHLAAQYVNGQLEGTYTLYYPNGKNMSERRYSKGVLEGAFDEWGTSGNKTGSGNYHDGKFVDWGETPKEAKEDDDNSLKKRSISKALKADIDGNGYLDLVVPSSQSKGETQVLFTCRDKIIKEVIIPEPMLEVYSARSREGQFGEPATPRDGLVVWGKGKQTRVYLYDFDKEEFDKTSYQSDLDI